MKTVRVQVPDSVADKIPELVDYTGSGSTGKLIQQSLTMVDLLCKMHSRGASFVVKEKNGDEHIFDLVTGDITHDYNQNKS